jgi:H+/gluconate symporter-like permease
MSFVCFKGGVQQLASHMVQKIGKKNIKLNQAVTHIVQASSCLVFFVVVFVVNCETIYQCPALILAFIIKMLI